VDISLKNEQRSISSLAGSEGLFWPVNWGGLFRPEPIQEGNSMAERKLVAKLADIGHGGDWFKKTSKQCNLPTMNDAKIMINDTDESGFDDLIVEFKKWRSHGRSQYPVTHVTQRLAVTGAVQDESSVACPAARVKAEDEVMLALEAAGTGTFRWDIRTDTITWDAVLDQLFGLQSPKTSRSLDQFLTLVHPDDRQEVMARCDRCRSDGEDFETEFRVVWPSGKVRWFYGRGKTIIEDGRPIYLTGACFDITQRKTTEMRREEALRENDRRKDQFLAHMSHEIRSPMTSILAYADILLSKLQDADDIECVKIIKQGGNHLLELIGDILDLSKIGSGKLKINREIVSLPTLINEVHSLMEVRAKEKKLSLILHYEGEIPESIETDRTRLRQILFNLVSNAIKFTAEGSVEIIARFVPNDSAIEVEVADTGIGISREQQGKLFQPFVQADSATTRGQEGTGLGLAITKQLVSMLGGEISFESVPNGGSTFRIRMPIACPRITTAGTGNGVNCAAAKRKSKILLVDDNQMVCKAIGRLLEISGHEVAVAFDGQSALEKAREFQADVVVLDLELPDMGGYELLGQLKKLKTLANTKSIALTGYGEELRRNAGVEFDHFLTKPADAKVLENLLLV
jgi:PAS domain S-box-containing protein